MIPFEGYHSSSVVLLLPFDFSKAFDSVLHDILCSKLKERDINLHVIDWVISVFFVVVVVVFFFLQNRQQSLQVGLLAIICTSIDHSRNVRKTKHERSMLRYLGSFG